MLCWGFNAYGQLGVYDTTDRLIPTVSALSTGDCRDFDRHHCPWLHRFGI